MEQKKYEELVENLFLIPSLLKKKLVKYDLYEEGLDLNSSHFHILFALEEVGRLTITELARYILVSKTNITPLIQKLINKKYVQRIYNEMDRRYIYINLTDEGKEFLNKHKNLVIKALKGKIANLNEEELQKLSDSLENLKEILNKID